MPRFIVKVKVTEYEFWRVTAKDAAAAQEDYPIDGTLFDIIEGDSEVISVKEK